MTLLKAGWDILGLSAISQSRSFSSFGKHYASWTELCATTPITEHDSHAIGTLRSQSGALAGTSQPRHTPTLTYSNNRALATAATSSKQSKAPGTGKKAGAPGKGSASPTTGSLGPALTTSGADQAADGQQQQPLDAMQVMLQAVENCKPLIKVQSNKSGAKMIHVPKAIDPREQRSYAIRWIVQAAQKRHAAARNTPFAECLALEVLQAYQRKGGARQKRDDVHKMALENRANISKP